MSFNKIIIVGNLGRDPELKYTPQGQQVCEFSVASSEKRKDSQGETTEETTWFKVSFWGRQAEVAGQYLAKGRQVYIEGRLRTREWTDKEGKARTSLEVLGSELKLLGSRGDAQSQTAIPNNSDTKTSYSPNNSKQATAKAASKTSNPDVFDDSITEDDIPF